MSEQGGCFPAASVEGLIWSLGAEMCPPPSSCVKDECESPQLWNLQVDASVGQRWPSVSATDAQKG